MILFELLTGELPFGARAGCLVQILDEEPPGLRKLDVNVPRDLETIAFKMLGKNCPAKRYQTASELSDELRRYVADEPVSHGLWGVSRRLALVQATTGGLMALCSSPPGAGDDFSVIAPVVAVHQSRLRHERIRAPSRRS